jgi:HlyD family secretion protein
MHRAARLFAVLAIALLTSHCAPEPPASTPGVVEADMIQVAAPAAGRVVELTAVRGSTVQAGAPLFRIESVDDAAALAEAESRVAQASAQLADLDKGKRPDEIAVNAAQVAQARSALAMAEAQLQRERGLVAQGFVSASRLDVLVSTRDEAAARLRELQAQQRVSKLPGRSDERQAAAAALATAQAQLHALQLRQTDKAQRAPVAALVDDTLYRVGETVAAGAPVVTLLPPANIKVRFFVAQALLPRLKPGDSVTVRCDGCPAPVSARIGSISHTAEFTPPVIYSREQRARLVYLVEAWPSPTDATRLRVGQPVDVMLPDAPS